MKKTFQLNGTVPFVANIYTVAIGYDAFSLEGGISHAFYRAKKTNKLQRVILDEYSGQFKVCEAVLPLPECTFYDVAPTGSTYVRG